jgi:2-polyprenyl-3-methyl-5-hydroxy-6-metoxy-1,4-benzoquinol methylase
MKPDENAAQVASQPRCPLTHSPAVRLLQTIPVSDIVALYRRAGMDVRHEFHGVMELGYYHAEVSDLKFFYPFVSGSPAFYSMLEANPLYYERDKFEFHVATSLINQMPHGASVRVLEVASGDGAFATTMQNDVRRTVEYFGIEFNPSAVARAAKAGLNIKLAALDDLNEPPFDTVCAFQVLEHVADVRAFLQRMIHQLLPNGKLILSVPNDDGFIGKTINPIFNIPPHHVTRWSEKAIRTIAREFNLVLMDMVYEPLPKIHHQWFHQVMTFDAWRRRWLPTYSRAVDRRFLTRVVMKLASLMPAKERADGVRNGHTLVAVFQKNAVSEKQ